MANENIIPQKLLDMDLPKDVQSLTLEQKQELATDIRHCIIQVVAQNGGHLAPSLGVVELTIALLSVFDPAKDHIIWDVGHQCYAWKLLTGRANKFHTLRQLDGIAGYPKISECPLYDHFGVGHASTSISAALGMAMARDLSGGDEQSIAIIGDGALTGGMAFEALNQAGGLGKKMIVILNDNEMSISHNVGALSQFLSRNLSQKGYMRFKHNIGKMLKRIPKIGLWLYSVAQRSEKSFKTFFTPSMLFEAFDFNYIGPVDGNDTEQLIRHLNMAKELNKPVLLHVRTKKGLGYAPAENNPSRFHRVPGFEPETGLVPPPLNTCQKGPGFTKVFGASITKLAEKDSKIVAISAAMPDGTGLSDFRNKFPDRFIDVGICEEHAVTFAAGMASRGYKPVVAIYSTFMQRAIDQVIHDVCIQNLPVVFCLDRAGIVGEDGPTHHGVFDLSILRTIPNMHILAPKDEEELPNALYTAFSLNAPVALRYPPFPTRSNATPSDEFTLLPIGKGEWLIEPKNKGICVIGVGQCVHPCREAITSHDSHDSVGLFNTRWVKPLPKDDLREIVKSYKGIIIVEENIRAGGYSSAVLEFLADERLTIPIKRLGLPENAFVEHGTVNELHKISGIDVESIAHEIQQFYDELC